MKNDTFVTKSRCPSSKESSVPFLPIAEQIDSTSISAGDKSRS